MTPPAITPAARGTAKRSSKGSQNGNRGTTGKGTHGQGRGTADRAATAGRAGGAGRAGSAVKAKPQRTGHRGDVAQPAIARRVSGPLGGVTRERERERTAQSPPRRSTTHRPARRPARRPAEISLGASLLERTAAFVRALPDHPLLDRIVRGRAWIPILGVLLAGIVAMQVEVLKLSATMGSTIQRGTALESRNQQLRASVAELSDDQRIERLAAAMGMVMPDPSAMSFLSTRPGDIHAALANIHQPDANGYMLALPAIDTPAGAAAAAAAAAAATGVTSTTTLGQTSSVATGTSVPATTTPATTTPVTTTPVTTTPVTSTPVTSTPATTSPATGSAGTTSTPQTGATSSTGASSATPTGGTATGAGAPTQQSGSTGAASASGG